MIFKLCKDLFFQSFRPLAEKLRCFPPQPRGSPFSAPSLLRDQVGSRSRPRRLIFFWKVFRLMPR